MTRLTLGVAAAVAALVPAIAMAETELSFYGGIQESPHANVTGTDPENVVDTNLDFTAGWEGKSFAMPPYYGGRVMVWGNGNFGWGAEYTHSKVYADDVTLSANGYDRFEFTDGLNVATINASYRWPDKWADVTPYVGAGVGFAFPHVDVQPTGGTHTFGYQITGPALRLYSGAKYAINEDWAVFGEYQFTYSVHDVELESGGGFETNVITNAINVGVSYTF